MRSFIYKVLLFTLPFFALYALNWLQPYNERGDLARMSMRYQNPALKKRTLATYAPGDSTVLESRRSPSDTSFDLFTIGDSFFEQGPYSTGGYLAQKGHRVLHFDGGFHNDPVQTLWTLLQAGYFDSVHAPVVVLETAERLVVQRCVNFDPEVQLDLGPLTTEYLRTPPSKSPTFFSTQTVKALYNTLAFEFEETLPGCDAVVAHAELDDLFSAHDRRLLFLKADHQVAGRFNPEVHPQRMDKVFTQLGRALKAQGMDLFVVIAPDKLDMYYTTLTNKHKWNQPVLFDYTEWMSQSGEYHFVPTKQVLLAKGLRDLYYYDDSHWTPKAEQALADYLDHHLHEKK